MVLVLLLITNSFAMQNNAEARGADEPCSYLNPSAFKKDAAGNCVRITPVGVNTSEPCSYLKPEKYQRDPNTGLCHKVTPSPQPQPVTPAAAMPNSPSNGGSNYYLGVNDLHASSQQVNCGAGTVLRNNVCVVGINDVSLTPDYTIYISNVILLCICGAVGFIIYKLGLYFHNRWDRTHNSRIDRDIIELTTDGRTQRSTTIANPNTMTVTAEVAKRIREYENDFEQTGQSDPEYFLVKWNAEFIDSSKRGNEIYANSTIIPGRTLKLVKYRDPSTGQLYLVHVPDGINDPDDGVGWTLGLSGDDYRGMGDEA
ncbi:hypothetical protein HX833_03870 [Marine Group I thaumarchaeote]|uniref:Uncharacterized protein n=1 Tax=Marine Group I thaumarchaeote TaxID=2511932 RepID=A0A7K4NQC3_9ARCH|nr:hypothetical protein [Marine Group I thaumarchaeote]